MQAKFIVTCTSCGLEDVYSKATLGVGRGHPLFCAYTASWGIQVGVPICQLTRQRWSHCLQIWSILKDEKQEDGYRNQLLKAECNKWGICVPHLILYWYEMFKIISHYGYLVKVCRRDWCLHVSESSTVKARTSFPWPVRQELWFPHSPAWGLWGVLSSQVSCASAGAVCSAWLRCLFHHHPQWWMHCCYYNKHGIKPAAERELTVSDVCTTIDFQFGVWMTEWMGGKSFLLWCSVLEVIRRADFRKL